VDVNGPTNVSIVMMFTTVTSTTKPDSLRTVFIAAHPSPYAFA
jgi:hypothetical protein